MAEGKARDRVESRDSARERNAGVRPQGPDVVRMDFFNGLLGGRSGPAPRGAVLFGPFSYVHKKKDVKQSRMSSHGFPVHSIGNFSPIWSRIMSIVPIIATVSSSGISSLSSFRSRR